MKTYDLRGQLYDLHPATHADIDGHFAVIEHWIPDVPADVFKQRMAECVDAGTAFHLVDTDVFLYYLNSKEWLAEGIAISGGKNPFGMIALFTAVFSVIDTKTFKLDFKLHPGKFIPEYKSILTPVSVKRHIDPNHPVSVRIDHLRTKFKALYDKKEFSWVAS